MATGNGPTGQVVTFYSFKGGTGRSMALANVAWTLAANGRRVLVADWDLDSPGLHRFFQPFLAPERVQDASGVIDLVTRYVDDTRKYLEKASKDRNPSGPLMPLELPRGWHEEYTRLSDHVLPVGWTFPKGGRLDLLSAGRRNPDYSAALTSLDWTSFYDRLDGSALLDALRDRMRTAYDVTLIDSRTGFNDVAEICTLHLPDTLVTCFTLSDQGLQGAAEVARSVRHDQRLRDIRVLPVPMRVDTAENDKRQAGLALARRAFAGLPTGYSVVERNRYWASVEVPYLAFYAYEETLAVFGDDPDSRTGLMPAYEALARQLVRDEQVVRPRVNAAQRIDVLERYRRPQDDSLHEVVLEYAAADQPWAEWITSVLSAVEVNVVDRGPLDQTEPPTYDEGEQLLTVVSPALPATPATTAPARRAVQVSAGAPAGWPAFRNTAYLAGSSSRDPQEAADRLLVLVGGDTSLITVGSTSQVPFPRREPRWTNPTPTRTDDFTGRTDLLLRLRDTVREHPLVALVGLGGIGKTQLAAEYVHRFRSSYQLIWWITAETVRTVEGSVEDLAQAVNIPRQAERSRTTATMLDALRRGDPTTEWLLVLDNAEEPAQIGSLLTRYLSKGPGRVLVTSRSTDWRAYARTLDVPVFRRAESTALLKKAAELQEEEADQLAEGLGDLPLAVDAAIGSLRSGRVTPRQFLERLPTAQAEGGEDEELRRKLQATFGVALDRLREQSPGSHRLLELLSVMAPDVSLDYVHGGAMAQALMPYDPTARDRSMRQSLLQRLERFSLVTVDPRERLVLVHRMLQEFVRGRMAPAERDTVRHQVHRILAAGAPGTEVDDPALWPAYRRLWPHLQASDPVGCPDPDVRQLLIDRVRYLWLRGDWSQGAEFGATVAAHWEALLAGPHSVRADHDLPLLRQQLLQLRLNLANTLREQGRFPAALAMDEASLAELTGLKDVGPDHALTLRVAAGYAADLRALGRYREALARERETSRRWSEHFGDDYPPALSAQNNLAVSLRAVGEITEATATDTTVYRKRSDLLGGEHPRTLDSANALGRDLRESGDYRSSVDWLRDVVRRASELAEPNPRLVLDARANLATSLRSQGELTEAGAIFDEVCPQLERYFGPASPRTLAARLNRAVLLFLLGRAEKADPELEAVATGYGTALGPAHPLRFVCLSNLSAVRRKGSRREPSPTLLAAEAAEGCLATLGASHPFTIAARMNVAGCLQDEGRIGDALVQLDAALAALEASTLDEQHPDRLIAGVSREILTASPDGPGSWVPRDDHALRALSTRLGLDHPVVRELRDGRLVPRFLDPNDPF